MNPIRLAVAVALTGMSATAALNGRFLHDLGDGPVSPHFDFRPAAPEKPIRALFLLDRRGARDAVEIVERFNVEPTYFLMPGGDRIAQENMYESAWKGTTVYEKTRELDRKLLGKFDLYVFGQKAFTSVNDEHRYRILKAVRDEGAGLLVVSDGAVKRMPYRKVYAEKLPTPAFARAFASEFENTALESWRLGRGIVAELSWHGPSPSDFTDFAPKFPIDDEWSAKYENAMAFAGAAMRYAAGRECEPSEPKRVRCRDRFNREVSDTACAGRYFRDTLGANGAVVVEELKTPSPVGGVEVSAPETIVAGRPFGISAKWRTAAEKVAKARVETVDSPYHRVMTRRELPLAAGAVSLECEIGDARIATKAGYVRVTLLDAGDRPLEIAERLVFLPKRSREDYFQMSWDSCLSMHPFLGSSILVDEIGFHYGLVRPSRDGGNIRELAILNQHAVVYATRIGIGTAGNGSSQYDFWWIFGDRFKEELEKLPGDDCFYRPEVQDLWRRGIAGVVRPLVGYAPAIYSLGDENYLHVNGGFGEYDDRYFREFEKSRYGTIENLNENWGTAYADFGEVEHLKPADAKAKGNFCAWFDHRAYIEKMYADAHDLCRDEIRKADPGAPVGAEGSEPGELELSFANQEFWGPYSNLIGDEVLRSLGGDRIRMLWWGGYPSSHGGRGTVPFPVPLMTDLAKGTVMGSAWFDVSIGTNHGFFYSDFRLADDVAAYIGWHHRFKDGLAQLLIRNPLADEGTLFYWSHPSATAAKATEKCLAPSDGLVTLICHAYRSGRSFEFVSSRSLDRLAKAKVVFLCGATALSDAEIAALKAFLARGGRIVADVKPALMNEFLAWRRDDAFAGEAGMTVLGCRLSLAHAREKTPGDFDRGIAKHFPEPSVYVPEARMHENAILRTRRGAGFDLVTAMWPAKCLGAKHTVKLPGKRWIYRPMQGFAGEADSLTLDFTACPFECYSVFAEAQTAPGFSVSDARLGGEVRTELPPPVSGRTMNLTVTDPDGRTRWVFVYDRAEVAPKDMFVAFDDRPGRWKATLVDVATGLRTEKSFEVRR